MTEKKFVKVFHFHYTNNCCDCLFWNLEKERCEKCPTMVVTNWHQATCDNYSDKYAWGGE